MISRHPPLLRAVRRIAPRICAAAGRDYDPSLLRAGLPVEDETPPPDDGEAHGAGAAGSLPDLIAAWLTAHTDRRRDGVYLTPRDSARSLLRAAAADGIRPRRVCDPAVGAGVFLEEAIALFGPDVHVWGLDVDPVAVALSRLAVWLAAPDAKPGDVARRIRLSDALLDPDPFEGEAPEEGFDLVCGNPPFGNAIEKRTARSRAERSTLRAIFPETARGPYDRSLLFVDLATRLLAPRGRYALLVPRALLAVRYATGMRALLERDAPIQTIVRFENDAPVPECEIFMVGVIGARAGNGAALESAPEVRVTAATGHEIAEWKPASVTGGLADAAGPAEVPASSSASAIRTIRRRDLSAASWGILLDPAGVRVERSAARHPRLGDSFDVQASASVAEAYAMAGSIREAHELNTPRDGWPLLTVRHIGRYRHRWGSVQGRILGRTFHEPFLPRDAAGLTTRRAALYDRPKILVAGLSRLARAVCDADGSRAGSVGTLCVVARGSDGEDARRLLRRATLLLNSDWISAVHRARRGPLALTGGSIPVGRSDIAAVPFPRILTEGEAAADDATREEVRGWLDGGERAGRLDDGERSRSRWLDEMERAERLDERAGRRDEADRALPREAGRLLAILDAAADALLDDDGPIHPGAAGRWDLLVQRVIDEIAGWQRPEGGA